MNSICHAFEFQHRFSIQVVLSLLLIVAAIPAADYTWDISSTAGIQTGTGTWGSNNYWTLTGGGGATLVAWPGTGNSATFEGVDGTYSVTLNSTQSVDSITFLFSGYTIDGGTIDAGSGLDIFTDSSKTATINSPVTGSAGLSKFGKGTLVLSGTNTFTGPVLFAGGTVSVAAIDNGGVSSPLGSSSNAAASLVFDGGTLEYTGAAQSTDRLLSIGLNGGSIINNGSGALTFTNAGAAELSVAGSRTFQLGGSSSAGNMITATIGDNGGATSLMKNGTGTWIITGDHTFTGNVIINSGTLQIGGGGTAGSINTADSVITNGTLVFNRSDVVTLSMPIAGTGTLVQNGTGTLILADSAGYTGTTTISSGTLQIGNGATTGGLNSTGGITNNSALVFNRSGWLDYSGIISGTGTVTKNGPGTLVFSGSNTYTGTTTVSAGSLMVAGSIAAGSAVTVMTGGSLGGNGSVNGTVSVQNGGTVAPGIGAAGEFSTADLTLNTTSSLEFELGTFSDTIVVNGNLVLDGDLNITPMSGFGAGTYRLMTYSGTLTDNVLTVASAPGGYTYNVTAGAGVVDLTVTTIAAKQWVGGGGNNLWSTPGNWSGSIVPTSADSVVFSSASYPCSLDVDPTVRCLTFEAGYTQTFYLNGHKLTVNKDLAINMTGSVFSNGNDTICFGGNESGVFVPKWGMPLPQLQRTGTGVTTVSTTGFRASGLLVTGGEFNFGYGLSDTIDGLLQVAGGSVHFASCTLYVAADVDFVGATAVVPDQGVLNFNGVSIQQFFPGNETPHLTIVHSGTGIMNVRNNRLRAGKIEVQSGSVVFDTALFADTVSVMSTTVLQLDTAAGNRDTILSLSGSGNLNFGKTELFLSSSVQMNMFSNISGTGAITFFGTDVIDFEPKSDYRFEKITKRGSGAVQVGMYGLVTNDLAIEEGVWNWYTSGNDTVYDSITISGGQMKLYSSVINTGAIRTSAGTVQCNTGTLVIFGNGGEADLSGLTALSADSGGLEFRGTGTSLFTLASNGTLMLPPITINGTSLDTVRFSSSILAKSVHLMTGILEFGNSFTHTVDSLFGSGGTMNFGSSTVTVTIGDADFSGLSGLIPGTGTLVLSGGVYLRYLTPSSTTSLPDIIKSGTDTVMISAYPLTCTGLTVNDGVFDFNGRDVTVNGDMTFTNGTDTMVTGLDGATLTVNGNAVFSGQSGNLLDLSPASAWTLSVTGILQADYAVIGKSNAGGGVQGQASVNCTDSGGNTNWYFVPPDTFPPDNPMTLQVTAVSTSELEVIWNPSAVAAADADSVGLWYKTDAFPDGANDVTATLIGKYAITDSVQTVSGLSPYSLYYVVAAIRDTLDQWSDINSANDTEYTYAEPPTVASPIDTVYRKDVALTWNNPAGLSAIDSVYIHWDTVPTTGWVLDTTLSGTENSCTVSMPFTSEGTFRLMISTSWDSAGLHHEEDAFIDTFLFSIDPPVLVSPADTVRIQLVPISWTNPGGLTSNDSVYLHIDTVFGSGWILDQTMSWTTTSATVDLPPMEGVYKYMLSTSLDSTGIMDTANRLIDTVVFRIVPPVITTPFDSTESLSPAVAWNAAEGMTVDDYYYVYDDTITGAWGWTFRGKMAYPSTGTTLTYGRIGTYRYRVTTSFDSLAALESENGAYDTIFVIDTTGPTSVFFSIYDNSGYTADNDPPLAIAVTGADSMRLGTGADTVSAMWKPVVSSDSISIEAGGEGKKHVCIQFKDTVENRSVWYVDSTMYDTTAPTGTGIVVTDINGYTTDPDPVLSLSATGADSMRIAEAADTANAAWKVYVSIDGIDLSTGGDGLKQVYAQFKDAAGNLTDWVYDSTLLDATVPSGTISISDRKGYTNDADPPLTVSATGADSMRIGLASDTASLLWSVFGPIDSISVSTGGEGTKRVYAQFKDISGNESDWAVDSTIYDTTGPGASVSTSGTFNYLIWTGAVSGTAADAGSGVDSVSVAIQRNVDGWFWNGTGWQNTVCSVPVQGTTAWQAILPDTVLGDGNHTVTVSVVDGAGNRDSGAAAGSFTWYKRPKARFSAVPGTGSVPLTVVFTDSSDGVVTSREWQVGDGAVDTAVTLTHAYQTAGWYDVLLMVSGPGGSDTVTKDSCIIVHDTTGPSPLNSVSVTALNCSTAVVIWTQPVETDVDSVSINISSTGFVATPANGERIERVGAGKLRDTLYGFPPDGMVLFITTFVKNTGGYWSYVSTASSVVLRLPDGSAPPYSLAVSLQSEGDTTVRITVDADTGVESGLQQWIGFGSTRQVATDSMMPIQYRDTSITTPLQTIPGWRYVASAVEDSAGNRSGIRLDSCLINNLPPKVTFSGDTLLREDTAWSAGIQVADFNGDQVKVAVKQGPEQMSLSGGTLVWTPDDADVGVQTVIVTGEDERGGVSEATITLIVENQDEPPVLTFSGDSVIDEDQEWHALLLVNDPDPGDSAVLTVERKPAWVSVKGDSLYGTPREENVGSDTLRCMVTDRTGLSDTLFRILKVENVNDTPAIVLNTVPDTVVEKTIGEAVISIEDPDADDTLSVVWVKSKQWLSAGIPVRDSVLRRWTVTLTATPQQRDTGTAIFAMAFIDRDGASVVLEDTIHVPDANDPPAAPKISRLVAGGAVQYALTTNDDYDTSLIYAVVFRSLDDSTKHWSDRSLRGRFSFYPLADAIYQLEARAIDQTGLETQPVFDTLKINGASQRVFSDTGWSMMAIPAPYRSDALKQTAYLLHWDESISERQVYHYYLRKDELPTIEPGYGYWRKGIGRDTVTIAQDALLRTPVTISLVNKVSGWNQIASPFPYPVIWRGKSSVLWKWNQSTGDFEESDSILEPWAGYWLQSDVTDSVTIDTVPFFKGSTLAKRRKVWFNSQHQWVFRAVLTTDEGCDAENSFGFMPEAKDGYDRLDRPEPPRMAGTGSLYFPRSGWKRGMAKFASDIRRKWDAVNMFEFGISGTSRSGTAKVSFEGPGASIPIYLFVTTGDSFRQVNPDEGITVPLTGSDSYRTLVVVDNVAALQRLPLRFSMGNAYPNPFCPSTRINYVLPYRWGNDGKMVTRDYEVAIELFDLKGRKIRTLVHRKMRPGAYQIFWDGKSSSGRVVASGHYYCRLKAAPFEEIRKLTLVR
ncbi:MAG: autotransporter-associated beta strand repeat-containing protein [Chitinispirillaceae bacterium]|nr:autotransporter-associated beta strand repeat-containing protein [Chitinispirillaceae bacterium]